jgi:hypothetical protein
MFYSGLLTGFPHFKKKTSRVIFDNNTKFSSTRVQLYSSTYIYFGVGYSRTWHYYWKFHKHDFEEGPPNRHAPCFLHLEFAYEGLTRLEKDFRPPGYM